MDQTVINWIAGFAGTLIGFLLKIVWDAIVELKRDLTQLEGKIHEDFVRRDDFKDSINDIKSEMREGFRSIDTTLGAIFKRLEKKEDRGQH